jgi:hypothetical protein
MMAQGVPARAGQLATKWARRAVGWWFEPLPRARIAWLRIIAYLFIFFDVFLLRPWVADNGLLPAQQYHPLMIGRLFPLPTPTPLVVEVVKWSMLAAAAISLSGRLVRIAGAAVFLLYLEWMLIAFSYGKVDHDRFAFLVALAVLPTVGKATRDDTRRDEASGWAVRCIQLAVVATYFFAAFAKFRFGGIDWVNGATLTRAILRRGTFIAEILEGQAYPLIVAQYALVAFELSSPLLLLRGKIGRIYLALAFAFHAITYVGIGIMFWPHVVSLFAFLPLERLGRERRAATLTARVNRKGSMTGLPRSGLPLRR